MDKPSYELIIRPQKRAIATTDILRDLLISFHVDPLRIVQEECENASTVSVHFDSDRDAERLAVNLRRLKMRAVKVSVLRRPAADWAERWKVGWKPFVLTRRFCVIPLWQRSRSCPAGKEPVFLDTTNAFGTGLHETTRFSAQLVDGLVGKFSSFLDVGTGSGILAIVAAKMGVKDVTAIDIDPEAVRVARENFRVNRLPSVHVLAADIGNYAPQRMFDLVAANLVTWDLVSFRNRILTLVKPGGHLVVSGVSIKNLSFFREHFRTKQLRMLKLKRGREWAAFLFQKRV